MMHWLVPPNALDSACHLMAARIQAEPGRWYLISPTTAAAERFLNRFKELYPDMVVENPGAANTQAQ